MIDLEQTESAIPEEIEETKRGSEFKSIKVQEEQNKGAYKKSDHKLDEELHEQHAKAHPKLHKHKDETAISGLQPNQALNKDLKRLSRIYGLLPEHHGKSITGVLSGATTNTRLPIWEAIQKAITKIQEEIFAEGDRTQVDLEYFQKLYSKLLQSSTQDSLELTRHAYSISPLETNRLNRLYTLLPEHHGKSITGVLSGATTNTRLPIWEAIQKAIAKIQEEIFAEGDQTQIDLEYFQKLHWSSMRVIGRGGGRKDSE
jgi:Mg2+ and Co2+ transporter CorA